MDLNGSCRVTRFANPNYIDVCVSEIYASNCQGTHFNKTMWKMVVNQLNKKSGKQYCHKRLQEKWSSATKFLATTHKSSLIVTYQLPHFGVVANCYESNSAINNIWNSSSYPLCWSNYWRWLCLWASNGFNQPYCWASSGYIQMDVPNPMTKGVEYLEISAGDYHLCGLRKP
jgi:hypothetical protein